MSERPGDPDARQRRLDALRGLAQDEQGQPAMASADATPEQPQAQAQVEKLNRRVATSPRWRSSAARALWRRWRAPALVIVAAVVIFGVVIGAILQNSGLRLGSPPPPALVGSVISLSAAGSLSCPSAPVWSPDGKQLAVVAVVGPSPYGCPGYNDVTSIQRSANTTGGGGDSNTSNNGYDNTTSGPPSDSFAIAIFDAASGHAVRTITLPKLEDSVLCLAQDPCGGPDIPPQFSASALQSLGWSPDGRSIAAFFTYTYFDPDQVYDQARGLLIITQVDGVGAPRTLIAIGRERIHKKSLQTDDFYSPPRFTWDLTAGSSTYADIQRGQPPATAPLAASYRLGANGALITDQSAQTSDVSPWRAGVLEVFTGQGLAQPYVVYGSSQWLWSPDSRYALPNVNLETYVTIAGIAATPPPDTSGLIPEPIITPPDAAMAQIVKAAVSANSNGGLARNPDGKLLAALLCAPSGAGQLTIRQVRNGQVVAQANHSFPLTSTSLGCAGDLSPIAWSPDGARIASSDGPDGQIIVWQVNLRG